MIILPVWQGNPIFFNSVNFHKHNNRNSVSSQKILQALGQNRKRSEQILNKRHVSLLAAQELFQQKYVQESLGWKQPSGSTGQIIHRKRHTKIKKKKKGRGKEKTKKREWEHASQEHQALLKIQSDLILHIMSDLNIVLCFITWSHVPTAHTWVWMLSGFEKVGCEMPFDIV